jgi:hypothetical protein
MTNLKSPSCAAYSLCNLDIFFVRSIHGLDLAKNVNLACESSYYYYYYIIRMTAFVSELIGELNLSLIH